MADDMTGTTQPKMLVPNQIEAHVTRLRAVVEGLKKYEANDGRAQECIATLDVAITILSADPYPPTADVAEVPPEEAPSGYSYRIDQQRNREG